MDKPATPDYYEALQISRAAQSLIVTKAYRLLAAFYHPDNKETGDRKPSGKSWRRTECCPTRYVERPTTRSSSAYPRHLPTGASPLCESPRSDGRRTSVNCVASCCSRSTTSAAPSPTVRACRLG